MLSSPDSPANPTELPAAVRGRAALRLSELLGGPVGEQLADALATAPDRTAVWLRVLGNSQYVFRELRRYPALVTDLLEAADWLANELGPDTIQAQVAAAVADCPDRPAFLAALRRARNWQLVRIAFRDLAGWSDFAAAARETTALAEAAVEAALAFAADELRTRFGVPRTAAGEEATFTVLGMGKLGGGELNFSSDIDLIFAYSAEGETDGPRALANANYFTRLGRQTVQALSESTADGFVYRVDMRLRPQGDSGPLAQSVDAMEEYYQVHGREWERYALVKARPIAGDRALGERFLANLQPFIFRRFLDFGAVEAVRDLKVQIQRQVENRRYRDHLKLGRGGIREIEFIVQAFQLLHGGRQKALRQRPTLTVLATLQELELLPDWDVHHLHDAYLFLRTVENRVQMADDQQTHSLPEDPDNLAGLAASLDFPSVEEFLDSLDGHRDRVQEAFDQTFAAPQTSHPEADPLERLWQGSAEDGEAAGILTEHGYLRPEAALETVDSLRNAPFLQRLTRRGRERLDRLMPLVMGAAGKTPDPATTLARSAELLEAIGGRSTYFALLAENPVALAQVVRLCGGSPFLARFLGKHPMLLDEILDPQDLYACRIRASRQAALSQELETAGDLEDRLNALRRFKNIEILHLAARDLQGMAPLEEVSRGLTEVAELNLEQVLAMAWDELTARFGPPMCTEDGQRRQANFLIVGMGKLGGTELGYGSDLDLLFLHDSRGQEQHTAGGPRGESLDNGRFFARLGQRLIHFITTLTVEGALYSIDMRLRPGGKSGPLVASLDHFRDYQRQEAWVWEHQALLRGRPVAGPAEFGRTFEQLRVELLAHTRDEAALADAVRDMRGRMLDEHGSAAGVFNLKRDRGGLIDIEFLIQYLCLRYGQQEPAILATSNRAALRRLAEHGFIPDDTARNLEAAYVLYRTLENRVKLFEDRAQVEVTEDPTWREQLDRMAEPEWRPVVERLMQTRDQVAAIFDDLLGPPARTG